METASAAAVEEKREVRVKNFSCPGCYAAGWTLRGNHKWSVVPPPPLVLSKLFLLPVSPTAHLDDELYSPEGL